MANGNVWSAISNELRDLVAERDAKRRQAMLDEIMQDQHTRAGEVHDLRVADARRGQYEIGDVVSPEDVDIIRRAYPGLLEAQQSIPSRRPALPLEGAVPADIQSPGVSMDGATPAVIADDGPPVFRVGVTGQAPPPLMMAAQAAPSAPTGDTIYRGTPEAREASAAMRRGIPVVRFNADRSAAELLSVGDDGQTEWTSLPGGRIPVGAHIVQEPWQATSAAQQAPTMTPEAIDQAAQRLLATGSTGLPARDVANNIAVRNRAAEIDPTISLSTSELQFRSDQRIQNTLNQNAGWQLRMAIDNAQAHLRQFQDRITQYAPPGFVTRANEIGFRAALEGLRGEGKQAEAAQVDQVFTDLIAALARVYTGGQAVTDDMLELASRNINRDWALSVILGAVDTQWETLEDRRRNIETTGALGPRETRTFAPRPSPVQQPQSPASTPPPPVERWDIGPDGNPRRVQ